MAGMRERRAPVKMNMSKKYVNNAVKSDNAAWQAGRDDKARRCINDRHIPHRVDR